MAMRVFDMSRLSILYIATVTIARGNEHIAPKTTVQHRQHLYTQHQHQQQPHTSTTHAASP